MATKTWQGDVKARIVSLVGEAGGPAKFARCVWGAAAHKMHLGKVLKWQSGESGIDGAEAVTVARKFRRRPAWLLLGDLPEFEDDRMTRTKTELEEDLAAYVASVVVTEARATLPAGVVEALPRMIRGKNLLHLLVEMAGQEVRANAPHYRGLREVLAARATVGLAAMCLKEGGRPELAADVTRALTAIERRLDTPPQPGKVITWQGSSRPAKLSATRKR